jgi:hypothetical protein
MIGMMTRPFRVRVQLDPPILLLGIDGGHATPEG